VSKSDGAEPAGAGVGQPLRGVVAGPLGALQAHPDEGDGADGRDAEAATKGTSVQGSALLASRPTKASVTRLTRVSRHPRACARLRARGRDGGPPIVPRARCGRPAERPVIGSGGAGREEERLPLCVDCLQLLPEDVRAFWDGMRRRRGPKCG
jgi:hypothetical protein